MSIYFVLYALGLLPYSPQWFRYCYFILIFWRIFVRTYLSQNWWHILGSKVSNAPHLNFSDEKFHITCEQQKWDTNSLLRDSKTCHYNASFFGQIFIRMPIKFFRCISVRTSGTRIVYRERTVYRERKHLEFFSLLKVMPRGIMWKTSFLFIKAFSFWMKICFRSIENRLRCTFFHIKVYEKLQKQGLFIKITDMALRQ